MEAREKIVNKMVEEGIEGKEIINLVISDSFQQINKATREHKTVEVSGLGKFVYNQRKADRSILPLKITLERTTSPLKKSWIEGLINYIETKG
jgi:nucleoid DNA-binding protein